jgi:hypothetical protein
MAQLSGIQPPQDYEATNAAGVLTFVFKSKSNTTVQKAGWSAVIYEVENYYNVTFDITDENKNKVNDATIVFDGYKLAKNQMELPFVAPGVYNYSVAKEGFDIIEETVNVTNKDEDVEVVFVKYYGITFNINVCGNPVEGAIIEVNEQTQTTNADGQATFSLSNNEYEYTVIYKDSEIVTDVIDNINEDGTIYIESSISSVTFTVSNDNEPLEGATIEINNQTYITDVDGIATVIFTESGDYEYTVTKDDFQTEQGNITVELCENEDLPISLTVLGIKETQSKLFTVIPNPAKGFVTIEGEGLSYVEIFDIQGRKLAEYNNIKEVLQITDLKKYQSGVYIIKMYSETKQIVTQRLTIVK